MLLDEPFGSLDASLREGLREDVARILKDTAATTILVTHDQSEALAFADHVAVLDQGRIVAYAEPRELYLDPPHLAAAMSIGDTNLIEARIEAGRAICMLGPVEVKLHADAGGDGPCRLLLRPEQLVLHPQPTPAGTHAVVVELQYHGHDALAHVKLDDPAAGMLRARIPGHLATAAGDDVWIEVTGVANAWRID